MDIGAWLRGLWSRPIRGAFRENEIDGEVLPELTDGDLEKLGVPLGHRKRLLKGDRRHTGPTAAPAKRG